MGENLDFEQLGQKLLKDFEEFQVYLMKVADSYHAHDVRPEVGCLPKKTVLENEIMEVYRYDSPENPPILIVNPLINGYYVLDLLPELSFTRFLTENGFSPYIIRWKNLETYDPAITFDYYVEHGVKTAAEWIAGHEKQSLILLGHCLGGLLSSAYLSVFSDAPVKKYISLNSPTDFSQMGLLNRLTAKEFIDVDRLVENFGNIPSDYMTLSFQFINPGIRLKAKMALFHFYFNPNFVRIYRALLQWGDDNINMPGEFARTLIKDFFQENRLFKNQMKVCGKIADLSHIQVPVLNAVSQLDDIAPYPACDALKKKAKDLETMVFPDGHLAIVTLSLLGMSPKPYWEQILAWMKK